MKTALLLAVLSLSACGKSSSTSTSSSSPPSATAGAPASASGSIDGTWSGTWQRTEPANMPGGGDFKLTVKDKTGTLEVTGSLCFKEPTPATVSVDGNTVTMEVKAGPITASYSGTRSGDEISGTLTVTCAPGTGKGTWKVKKS